MGACDKILASIISVSMLNSTSQCSMDTKSDSFKSEPEHVETAESKNSEPLEIPDLFEVQKKAKKEISVCLNKDKDSHTHKKVLESITDPNNTILEFPVSQLFEKYGNRSHPLAVRGIKKDFRALLGKDGIENLSDSIPQKLSPRAEEITSDTQYEAGDTLRFTLINPLLQGAFPQYLSNQLKEDGFETFSDTESSLVAQKIERKNQNGNWNSEVQNESDYIYDIVVKKLSDGKSALALYRDGELFMATYVSIGLPVVWTKYGKRSAKTKRGQFKMIKEDPYYYSRKYKSPMPCGINFDEGGFWFHQGNVTGYPASHGCVRQPGIYSLALYSLVKDKKHVDVFIDNNLYKTEK